MKAPRELPRWGVYLFRKKAERLGSVKADSQEEALTRAVEEYGAHVKERWRISVKREDSARRPAIMRWRTPGGDYVHSLYGFNLAASASAFLRSPLVSLIIFSA